MRALHSLILLFFITACASYQPGKDAEIVSGQHPSNFPIFVDVDYELSTNNFLFLNITYGNNSNEWIRIKSNSIHLTPELESKVYIPVGQDLKSWVDSINYVRKIDSYNHQLLVNSLATIGLATAAAGAGGNNDFFATLGMGLTTTVFTVEAFNEVNDKINDLQRSQLIPMTHFYAPTSVPPGLYTKRWILLQYKDSHPPCQLDFQLEYLDGRQANYKVNLGLEKCTEVKS